VCVCVCVCACVCVRACICVHMHVYVCDMHTFAMLAMQDANNNRRPEVGLTGVLSMCVGLARYPYIHVA
jgi:hypothetical protein